MGPTRNILWFYDLKKYKTDENVPFLFLLFNTTKIEGLFYPPVSIVPLSY